MDILDNFDIVWAALHDVVEENQDLFNAPELISIIAQFATTMACDMAPSIDEAEELINDSTGYIINGYRVKS